MSHTKRMAARINGLAPACLNFLKLDSIPIAVIAMVSAKASARSMPFTTAFGNGTSELTMIAARKPMTNHGIKVLLLLWVSIEPSGLFFFETRKLN